MSGQSGNSGRTIKKDTKICANGGKYDEYSRFKLNIENRKFIIWNLFQLQSGIRV